MTGIGYQTLDQRNSIPTDDSVDTGDQFGYALAAGNFNRTRLAFAAEPYADLAVGVPGEDIGAISNAGTVSIFYGSSTGLRDAPREVLSQNTGDVPDQPDAGDRFGAALAVGNYNGEFGPDDELTIGVPDEDTTASQVNVGAVNVLFGSATGLNGTNSQLWYQGFKGVNDTAESYDSFGQVAQ